MTGYEEAVTDPSYVAQVLCFSLSADRHVRRRRGADGVGSRAVRGRRDARRAARVRAPGCASSGVVALTSVDTRTLVRKIRDGGVLRCALGDAPVEELRERALAEPFIDGNPLPRQPWRDRAVLGRRRAARRRRRPRRRSARSRTGSPTPASRRTSCPGAWDADAILEADPRVVLIGNGPGDPAMFVDQIETIRAAARPRAALRRLPRPPAARARARPQDLQAAVRPPRREPSRCATSRRAACSSPCRTTASR